MKMLKLIAIIGHPSMSSDAGASVGGIVLIFLSCTIASAGGVGGGGIILPLLLAVFKFSYNEAVVLSQCTVLGNYIIQSMINFRKRHPFDVSRPLIYWDVVLILLPAQIGGSTIGVIVEKVLPETLLLIIAIIVVFYAGGMTSQKGVMYWMKETDEMSTKLMHSSDISETPSQDLLKVDNPPEFQMPYFTLKVLVASWFVYAALLVTTQVAVSTCSVGYILTLLSIYPLVCCLIAWGVSYAAKRQREHPSSVLPGDISFKDISFVPPLLAFLIGIMCSLLGIGGGELMGPLLLSYQVISPVSTATTSMMSLATASSNILHYGILNEIDYRWAVGLFVAGLCGGGTGRTVALAVVSRLHRQSVLIFALVTVLVISLCILIYEVSSETPAWGLRIFC